MGWLEKKIDDLKQLNEQFIEGFGHLNPELMDLKQDEKTWSINECIDHIIQTNRKYFEIFDAINTESYKSSRWSKIPILPRFLGKLVLKVVSPGYQGKIKTSTQLYPLRSKYHKNLAADLQEENLLLIRKFGPLARKDLDQVIVTSPMSRLVSYSLRDCIELLVEHEKRHYNQSVRLRTMLIEMVDR